MIRLVALLMILATPAAACRQALALALDVSGSVDAQEYRLQRDGLATALTSPRVKEVLFAPGAAPIRIAVFEWSGPVDQTLILPWVTLSDETALNGAVARLRAVPRAAQNPTTAIGPALVFGFDLLSQQPDCWKRTLDVSGDGLANTGPHPRRIALPAALGDVIVNGLVVGVPSQDGGNWGSNLRELSSYFSTYVVRGPGAFVEVALGYEDYAAAMERKLLRELETLATSAAEPHRDTAETR